MSSPLGWILALVGVAVLTVGAGRDTSSGERDQHEFIRRHWRTPLASQGKPPSTWSPAEASLQPEACGGCHPVQLADWSTSIHAASMGPAVVGQLGDLHARQRAAAGQCYACHAPLAEQRPGQSGYDPGLRARGIVCAACHVRRWQRFGPPRRDGSLGGVAPRASLPHNSATRTPAFLRSEFCRDCHQFGPRGLALNGKLLQDTFEEWKASPAARSGVQCQGCHMPDRRHLWRGIHDPHLVRAALDVSAGVEATAVTLAITNARGGHFLPTYVTPRIVVSGEVLGSDGRPVKGSRKESVIGRVVTLDLSQELLDTRLAPTQTARFRYPRHPGERVRLRILVEPDSFYTRFFEARLSAGAGTDEVRAALEATRRSPFTIFEQDYPPTTPSPGAFAPDPAP